MINEFIIYTVIRFINNAARDVKIYKKMSSFYIIKLITLCGH